MPTSMTETNANHPQHPSAEVAARRATNAARTRSRLAEMIGELNGMLAQASDDFAIDLLDALCDARGAMLRAASEPSTLTAEAHAALTALSRGGYESERIARHIGAALASIATELQLPGFGGHGAQLVGGVESALDRADAILAARARRLPLDVAAAHVNGKAVRK